MKLLESNNRARFFAATLALCCLLSLTVSMRGQDQQTQLPARGGYVNDYAGIIDAATKDRMEAILTNLKQRTDIEFVVAAVKTIGNEDVYEYSLRLARAWDVGTRANPKKSVLLVLSVNEARYFTQFSRSLQEELPDGTIGELTLRLREKVQNADFSGGLFDGVKSFVGTVGERKNFKFEDLDQAVTDTVASNQVRHRTVNAETSPQPRESSATKTTARPAPSETPAPTPSETPKPSVTETPSPSETPKAENTSAASPTPASAPADTPKSESPAPTPSATETPVASPTISPDSTPVETPRPSAVENPIASPTPLVSPQPRETPAAPNALPTETPTPDATATSTPEPAQNIADNRTRAASRNASSAAKKPTTDSGSKPAAPPSPEDEKEQVELTLTLPVDKRIDALRAFIAAHPKSVAVPRANELIVVAHATLGDQKLQTGDANGGLAEFQAALAEAPADMTDRLFTEVIARIPMNLFLRDRRDAAIDFARQVEALAKLNPKRLLALAEFYLNTENVSEANRIAELTVQQAPESAAAHQALGAARHIDLRLDEAEKEYARAVELDPKSVNARRSLADLKRAEGKADEALALYRQLVQTNPDDKTALAGVVVSLLESGKREDADRELDAALKDKDQAKNFALLAGAAYWFIAHNDAARALDLAAAAVNIEPRYSWSQIALARALVASKRPFEAERALRFARQYGAFPTLDYELANVLAAMGLYDEAAIELARSFSIKDGQIEGKLAGRNSARASNFMELLAPERRAAIFQSTAADSEANTAMLKGLLSFATMMNVPETEKLSEEAVLAAANQFIAGDDPMRPYRQIYVAGKLIGRGMAYGKVLEMMDAATNGVEAALTVPAATVAVQPDELRETRARALAQGGTPDVPEAPRTALSGLLRARIEDLAGRALLNQDKADEAVTHLRRAVSVATEGTPLWRATLWHLGSALEASGKNDQALLYYIKYYVTGRPDPVRRAVIENIYQKVNGSLEGLDEKIGPGFAASPSPTSSPTPNETR
jgi:tetratricopeptide (TPR) repeat protein